MSLWIYLHSNHEVNSGERQSSVQGKTPALSQLATGLRSGRSQLGLSLPFQSNTHSGHMLCPPNWMTEVSPDTSCSVLYLHLHSSCSYDLDWHPLSSPLPPSNHLHSKEYLPFKAQIQTYIPLSIFSLLYPSFFIILYYYYFSLKKESWSLAKLYTVWQYIPPKLAVITACGASESKGINYVREYLRRLQRKVASHSG